MKRSVIFAIVLSVAAIIWLASGKLGDGTQPEAQKPPADLTTLNQAPLVRVRVSRAEPHEVIDLLRGRTEANRRVEVKSETDARVIELAIDHGSRVKAGDVIARLAAGDRQARLAEARALLAQRRIEYAAAQKLSEKGFRAETQLAATEAELQAAEAAVTVAEVELGYTTIRAPFDGIIDRRLVEIGTFVDRGDPIARLVELDPILIVTQVNERDIQRLSIGAPGKARLMSGALVEGRIRHIASVADEATRTFRVELEVANPDGRIADGMTAEIALPLSKAPAHRVSPAVLTLSDNGEIGVKTVEVDNRVVFYAVKIVDTDAQGMWITGLPDEVTLITVGQEYVAQGDIVRTVSEEEIEATLKDLAS